MIPWFFYLISFCFKKKTILVYEMIYLILACLGMMWMLVAKIGKVPGIGLGAQFDVLQMLTFCILFCILYSSQEF